MEAQAARASMAAASHTPTSSSSPSKAIVIGISGPSSSGKTTLARILAQLIPVRAIIHQDDYYKPEDQLPLRSGLKDWDSVEAFDMARLASTLRHVRATGELPDDIPPSTELAPSSGSASAVNSRIAASLRFLLPLSLSSLSSVSTGSAASHPLSSSHPPTTNERNIYILEGIQLYSPSLSPSPIPYLSPIRLFLLSSYDSIKRRREKRTGYVTDAQGGFWVDPPGYVDRVVWPAFVESHAPLFVDGEVHGGRGVLDEDVVGEGGERLALAVWRDEDGDDGEEQKGEEEGEEESLRCMAEWAVRVLADTLPPLLHQT